MAATVWSILILVIAIATFVWLPAEIARRKGRSPWMWAVLGFLFSVITLIVIAVLPSNKPTAESSLQRSPRAVSRLTARDVDFRRRARRSPADRGRELGERPAASAYAARM